VVPLSEKEAVGVYLLLRSHAAPLDVTMARLRERIEDSLFGRLTVGEVEDLDSVYRRLPDGPPEE
jgi:hypothetical protein